MGFDKLRVEDIASDEGSGKGIGSGIEQFVAAFPEPLIHILAIGSAVPKGVSCCVPSCKSEPMMFWAGHPSEAALRASVPTTSAGQERRDHPTAHCSGRLTTASHVQKHSILVLLQNTQSVVIRRNS